MSGGEPRRAQPHGPEPPRGPGFAAERTTLAWSRSGLSLIGCGVLILRGLPTPTGTAGHPIAGAIVLVLGLIAWGVGRFTTHRRQVAAAGARPVMTSRELAPVAYGTAALGVAGAVLAFFHVG